MSNIVVLADARQGKIKKPSLEAVGAAIELAAAAGGDVIAVVAGAGLDAAKQELAASGAKKVVAIDSPALEHYSGDGYAKVLHEQIAGLDAAAILMPHSAMARDLMPRLAASFDTGLVSDCTALHFENGKFGATKPVFAGKAYKKSFSARSPFMATLRPNNWEAGSGSGAEVVEASPTVTGEDFKAIVQDVIAAGTDRVPLQEAKVVVCCCVGDAVRGALVHQAYSQRPHDLALFRNVGSVAVG